MSRADDAGGRRLFHRAFAEATVNQAYPRMSVGNCRNRVVEGAVKVVVSEEIISTDDEPETRPQGQRKHGLRVRVSESTTDKIPVGTVAQRDEFDSLIQGVQVSIHVVPPSPVLTPVTAVPVYSLRPRAGETVPLCLKPRTYVCSKCHREGHRCNKCPNGQIDGRIANDVDDAVADVPVALATEDEIGIHVDGPEFQEVEIPEEVPAELAIPEAPINAMLVGRRKVRCPQEIKPWSKAIILPKLRVPCEVVISVFEDEYHEPRENPDFSKLTDPLVQLFKVFRNLASVHDKDGDHRIPTAEKQRRLQAILDFEGVGEGEPVAEELHVHGDNPRQDLLDKISLVKRITKNLHQAKFAQAADACRAAPLLDPAVPEVFEELQRLHPVGPSMSRYQTQLPRCLEDLPGDKLAINEKFVGKLIKSSKKYKCAGMSGMTNEHLQFMAKDKICLRALTYIVQGVVLGLVAPAVLTDCYLIALDKRKPEQRQAADPIKIRPIAISEAILRLSERAAMRLMASEMRDYLEPIQMGVGTPAGCESVIHRLRKAKHVIAVDCTNAFNCISRVAIYDVVKAKFPELAPMFLSLYSTESRLYCGESHQVIFSKTGVRQGDPLSPALFCLGLHPVLLGVDQAACSVTSYMDDIYLYGEDSVALLREFEKLCVALKEIKLEVNVDKCQFYSPTAVEVGPETGPKWSPYLDVLGAYLGTDEYVLGRLGDRRLAWENDLDTLMELRTVGLLSYDVYSLLRFCFSPMSRIGYLSRVMPSDLVVEGLGRLDDKVSSIVARLCNVPPIAMDEYVQARIQLPIANMGLGLASVRKSALCNHYASLEACGLLTDERKPEAPLVEVRAKVLACPIRQNKDGLAAMYSGAEDKSRLACCFLVAVPYPQNPLNNDDFACALRLRLAIDPMAALVGFQIHPSRTQMVGPPPYAGMSNCPLCGSILTPAHPTHCSRVHKDVIFRHDGFTSELADIGRDAGILCYVEPYPDKALRRATRQPNTRCDIEYFNSSGGVAKGIDVAVTSGLIINKEREKISEYTRRGPMYAQEDFTPVVINSLGKPGDRGYALISRWMYKSPQNALGSYLVPFRKQRLSLCFQRYQARVYRKWVQCAVALRYAVKNRT